MNSQLKGAGQQQQPSVVERDPASKERRKPSIATLQSLLAVRQRRDLDMLIERLQKQTCDGYTLSGVGAESYEQPFDDLHCCRLVRMALDFRTARGLPPDACTPYDDADMGGWLDEAHAAPGILEALGDAELLDQLAQAHRHNPVTGFCIGSKTVVAIRKELDRRKEEGSLRVTLPGA